MAFSHFGNSGKWHEGADPVELIRQRLGPDRDLLTREQRDEFEERAAIREFCGRFPRPAAEYLAMMEVLFPVMGTTPSKQPSAAPSLYHLMNFGIQDSPGFTYLVPQPRRGPSGDVRKASRYQLAEVQTLHAKCQNCQISRIADEKRDH